MTKKRRGRRPGQGGSRGPSSGQQAGKAQPLRPPKPAPSDTAGAPDATLTEGAVGTDAAGTAASSGADLAPASSPKPASKSSASARGASSSARTASGRGGSARAGSRRTSSRETGSRGDARRPPPPPGLFGFLRAPSPYPKLGHTLGRAAPVVLGQPVLVVLPLVLVMVMWLGLVAAGLDHVPQGMVDLLAIPPISSFFDLNIVVNIVGLSTGTILYTVALTVVRAVVWAVLVGLVVQSLDEGRTTVDGARRGLRAVPGVLAVLLVNMAIIFLSQILRFILGASIGSLAFFGGLVGGLYFIVFAPVILVREGGSARAAIGTSVRAARLPGPRHVGMVFLYFSLSFFAFLPAGRAFTANPTFRLWLFVLAGTVLHLLFMAGFAYRYTVVREEIPPPAPRQARPRRRLL